MPFRTSANKASPTKYQVDMTGKEGLPKNLNNLRAGEKDLKMFTMENLTLSKSGNLVKMEITLKRKMSKELLTTFLPMVLLLLVTFASILF